MSGTGGGSQNGRESAKPNLCPTCGGKGQIKKGYGVGARYSAFSVSGKVQVQQDKEWKLVTKQMLLGAFDQLIIPEDGNLKVLDTRTNAIYKSLGAGNMSVHQLVHKAKGKADQTLSTLTEVSPHFRIDNVAKV